METKATNSWQSSPWNLAWDRAIVNQTNNGSVSFSRATLGFDFLGTGWSTYQAFWALRSYSVPSWTELNVIDIVCVPLPVYASHTIHVLCCNNCNADGQVWYRANFFFSQQNQLECPDKCRLYIKYYVLEVVTIPPSPFPAHQPPPLRTEKGK